METPNGMDTSDLWEDRQDESHLKEKYSQAVPRNSFPLRLSFMEVGEGGGFGWSGVEGWGENIDNCN